MLVVRSGLFKQKGNTSNPFSMTEKRKKGRLEGNFLFHNIRIQILQSTYKLNFLSKKWKKIVMIVDHVSLTSHVHY